MKIDQHALSEVVARITDSVAAARAGSRSRARLALLRLQDSLERLRYMLAAEAPIGRYRAWHGDKKAAFRELFDGAADELAFSIGNALPYLDASLEASLQRLANDLAVFVAGVFESSRGTSRERGRGGLRGLQRSHASAAAEASGTEPFDRTVALDATEEGETPQPEQVCFCASAPVRARLGDEFVARFAAYLPEDEPGVREVLVQTGAGARFTPAPKRGGLLRGTEVEVVLQGTGLIVDGGAGIAVQRLTWEGRPHILEFGVQLPAALEATPRNVVLGFYVQLGGVVLERVLLDLAIVPAAELHGPARQDVRKARLPATAFASYSSADRLRVLDRVAAIRIAAGIDVFLDCMDLNPSEAWEPRLQEEIDRRDLFILFWSQRAAESRWVTWEWERALAGKGPDAMQIQPLENGIRPPRALRAVHLADAYMDLRAAETQRRSRMDAQASCLASDR